MNPYELRGADLYGSPLQQLLKVVCTTSQRLEVKGREVREEPAFKMGNSH